MSEDNGKLLCTAAGKLLCHPTTGKLLYGIESPPGPPTGHVIVTSTSWPFVAGLRIGDIWSAMPPWPPYSRYYYEGDPSYYLDYLSGAPVPCQGNAGWMIYPYADWPNSCCRVVGPASNNAWGVYHQYYKAGGPPCDEHAECWPTGKTVTFAIYTP